MDNAPIIRVLLVFSEKSETDAIRDAFASSDEPFGVKYANTVAEALSLLAAEAFDFVVAAVHLGDGGAGEIALRSPMVPCVAVGPSSERASLDAALDSGAVDYVLTASGWQKNLVPHLHHLWYLRKRLALELGHASKRYEDLVQALPDIIYELDTEGRFTFVNQSVKMLGYSAEELVGKHFSELLFEEDVPHVSREHVLPLYNKNRTGAHNAPKLFDERRGVDRKTENLELRLKRKGGGKGRELIASVISYGEVASAGAYRNLGELKEKVFVGTVGIIRDITLRRRSEDMLRKMYQAVDQSPAAVAILDRELSIEYVNPAFFGMMGTGPEQALGKKIGEYLGEASDRSTYEDLVVSVRAGIDWRGELRCPRVGGNPFWASVLVSAIRSPSGAITHFLCLLEDVTRKRTLDELLKEAKDSAEEASRAKSEFLANMSHELRTPLSGIISLTEVLISDSPRENQMERLASIRSSATHLLSMLNDLLDLSKIEARVVDLKMEDFDLTECAESILVPFKALAEEKGLSFRYLVDDGGSPRLNTDRGRLSQIVSNLVSNAVKFTEAGSIDVRFAVRAKDDMPALFVSVRDTGIGISGVDQQKLFKHFSQVDSSSSKKFGGTGLGLAISKELALRLGGDVWVESSPGAGSTFAFYIPVRSAGKISAPADDAPFVAPRSYSLLVAEDNPVNRDYLRFFLEKAGHRIRLVSDGYEVLAALEKGDFDAVLMDIQMPKLDGIATTTTIRAYSGSTFDPRIPIIALTAFDVSELGDAYELAGFDAYVAKPINARNLIVLIDEIIRTKDRFDVDRIKRQYAASADEFRRLLLIASKDLPKRVSAFEAARASDNDDAAKSALHGVVNVLSAIGALRALQLVKRYRKAVKAKNDEAASLLVSDLLREIDGIKSQVKKELTEL